MKISDALKAVEFSRLRDICKDRGLSAGGSAKKLRSRLARSFRGDAEEAFSYFKKRELITVLEAIEFEIEGYVGQFVNLQPTKVDTLREIAVVLFGEGWEPADRRSVPVRGAKPVAIDWIPDPTAGQWDEDEEDDDEEEIEDFDADEDEDAGDDDAGTDALVERLERRLSARGRARERVADLVNLLGEHRAVRRLRAAAVRHLGRTLADLGYATEPDLQRKKRSPGIDAVVTVSRAEPTLPRNPPSASRRPHDNIVEPTPPPAPEAPPAPTFTAFEVASRKLAVIVTLAATTSRLGEADRARAIEASTGNEELSRAQAVRLRGLAHKYAAGHSDLTKMIDDLHKALPESERRAVLEAASRIGPPSATKDDLIAAYAADLGVSYGARAVAPAQPDQPAPVPVASPIASPPEPPPAPPPPAPAPQPVPMAAADRRTAGAAAATTPTSKPREPAPVRRGGVRDNGLADDIFGGDE